MYYLGRSGYGVPSESPFMSSLGEQHEWGSGMHRHQEALKNVKSQLHRGASHSVDSRTLQVQANTRRFCEDLRRAEIGRENRKLVDRLHSIAKGQAGHPDPRAPPPQPRLGRVGSSSVLSAVASSFAHPERSRSLNEPFRRKTQRGIDHDNASLVRRILAVKSTFDIKGDERDFKKHRKTAVMLQRSQTLAPLNRSRSQPPRGLPPVRAPRPLSSCAATASGLESLLLPGFLRSSSGPLPLQGQPSPSGSSPGRELPARSLPPPLAPLDGAADAPASPQEDSATERSRGAEQDRRDSRWTRSPSPSDSRSRSPSRSTSRSSSPLGDRRSSATGYSSADRSGDD